MIYMFKAMHYCLHIYLKIYRIKCIEIYELNPDHFFHVTGLAWHACVKKTGVELESLTFVVLRPKRYSYLDIQRT